MTPKLYRPPEDEGDPDKFLTTKASVSSEPAPWSGPVLSPEEQARRNAEMEEEYARRRAEWAAVLAKEDAERTARAAAGLPEIDPTDHEKRWGFDKMIEIPLKDLPDILVRSYAAWRNTFTLYRAFKDGDGYTTLMADNDRHWWRLVDGQWVPKEENWQETIERQQDK